MALMRKCRRPRHLWNGATSHNKQLCCIGTHWAWVCRISLHGVWDFPACGISLHSGARASLVLLVRTALFCTVLLQHTAPSAVTACACVREASWCAQGCAVSVLWPARYCAAAAPEAALSCTARECVVIAWPSSVVRSQRATCLPDGSRNWVPCGNWCTGRVGHYAACLLAGCALPSPAAVLQLRA